MSGVNGWSPHLLIASYYDLRHGLPGGPELSSRPLRQIEKAGTSLVLNIAEGNGRCLEADRRKFLETAESATVKAGAFLDHSHRACLCRA